MSKRILSVILALIMIMTALPLTFSVQAEDFINAGDIWYGDSDNTTPEEPTTPTPIDPTPEEPEPLEPTPVETDDTVVARIYLCSTYNSILPNVFVYVLNLTNHPIKVGLYDCPKDEGISLGSFGMTVSDGAGVYYNVEAYRNRNGAGGLIHISKNVTNAQLKALSAYVKSVNWWDPLFVNCCFFAATCWNRAGGQFFFPMTMLPWIARAMIRARGAESNLVMTTPDTNNVYRQKNGKLIVCSSGSLS